MNKLFIVLLAVCLVSVHAFVKRDAPAAQSETSNIQKQFEDIAATAKNIGDNISKTVSEALDSEKLKQQFNELMNAASKAIKGNFSGIQCSSLSDFELQRRTISHIFKMNKLLIVLLAVCLVSINQMKAAAQPKAA
ncbi:hypothetical protein HF086_000142 [Spodoptera exigua]|uniref:Uncharacterized protein n=1 Tax=Spodoptera exigua TaxID=7107 RepID=A0A922SBD3_SPOEX|nr:hypothetical protein HF086_000142 [Spodoptera exigua]